MSLPIRTLILLDQGPILMTSFNLSYFCKGLTSNGSPPGGWGFHMCNFRPNTDLRFLTLP